MPRPVLVSLCAFVSLVYAAYFATAAEYRIDSQADFDALREHAFLPGDIVLFRRGVRVTGMFAPRGCGKPQTPIRIEPYGTGPRPRIDAEGKYPAAVLLHNADGWEITGLEVTNTDGSDRDQGALFGILVQMEDEDRLFRHFVIDDCFVHDVNALVGDKRRGGIHVRMDCRDARVDDLQITNNRIERVGGVGIATASSCGGLEFDGEKVVSRNLWTNVSIAGNYVSRTGRNAIILRCAKDAVCEYNTLAHSSRADVGHSVFCFDSDGTRIQFNEAYGNIGDEGQDRGGFDADYNCINTLIQYNYSHDNMWFCGIMKRHNRNVTIRYNLSVNDRQGIYCYGFESKSQAEQIHVYNNTHYVGRGLKVAVFLEDRTPLRSRFENNVFYFAEHGTWGSRGKGKETVFRNNLYVNIEPHPTETRPIVADPAWLDPQHPGTDIDMRTRLALRGFGLHPASPCIDAGLVISGAPDRDLLGNPIPFRRPDLGAVEWLPPGGR
ncbi:hypothetical protein JCM19992_04650 [Thermostilla marina]